MTPLAMRLTDRAIAKAHVLLATVGGDERLPYFYLQHPGLDGFVAELRVYLERGVLDLASGRMSRERAAQRALRVINLLRVLRCWLDEEPSRPAGDKSETVPAPVG